LVSTNAAGTKSTTMAGEYSGNALGFKGSEDLGGMKANFQVEVNPSTLGATAPTGYQSFAGLEGAFGTVRAGQFFNYQFSNNALGSADGLSVAGGYSRVSETATGSLQGNAVEYTLPSIVTGLGVGFLKSFDNGTYANAATGTTAVNTNQFRLTYNLGALNVGYAQSKAATATGGHHLSKQPA